jgi:hypothetical protein
VPIFFLKAQLFPTIPYTWMCLLQSWAGLKTHTILYARARTPVFFDDLRPLVQLNSFRNEPAPGALACFCGVAERILYVGGNKLARIIAESPREDK